MRGLDVGITNHATGDLNIDFGAGGGRLLIWLLLLRHHGPDGYLPVGDFNGDSHPDLAFAGYTTTPGGTLGTPIGYTNQIDCSTGTYMPAISMAMVVSISLRH